MCSFFVWTQRSALWYKYCIHDCQINAEYVQYCNKLTNCLPTWYYLAPSAINSNFFCSRKEKKILWIQLMLKINSQTWTFVIFKPTHSGQAVIKDSKIR